MNEYLVTLSFRGNRAPHRYYLIKAASLAEAEKKAQRCYDSTEGALRLECSADAELVTGDLVVPRAARHLFDD